MSPIFSLSGKAFRLKPYINNLDTLEFQKILYFPDEKKQTPIAT